jgi:hypothetical protein
MRLLTSLFLFTALAYSQTEAREFALTHVSSAQGLQEIANALQAIANVPPVTIDDRKKTLAVNGTESQIALSDWLIRELDIDARQQHAPAAEYAIPGADDDLARVFYLPDHTTQQLQELVNAIRVMGDVQRLYPVNGVSALSIRGTSVQMAMVAWILETLDQPAAPGKYEFTIAGADDTMPHAPGSLVRIFFLTHHKTPQGVQEVTNATRVISDMQKVFPYNSRAAIVARGRSGQIAMAEWLIRELDIDAAPARAPAQEYAIPGAKDDLVRVFYLPDHTLRQIQEVLNTIRTIGDVQKMFPTTGASAISMRGTSAQMALAAWIVDTLDQPAGPDKHEFTIPGVDDSLPHASGSQVRIFFLAQDKTVQAVQEVLNATRTITDIQKLFPYTSTAAIAARGRSGQIALAEWLVGMLDRPAVESASASSFTAPDSYPPDSNMVRVFYLPRSSTTDELAATLNAMRRATGIQKLFPCNSPRAIAVRGTTEQVAQAESVWEKSNKAER